MAQEMGIYPIIMSMITLRVPICSSIDEVIKLTWLSILFTDKPLAIPCMITDSNGNTISKPIDYEAVIEGNYIIDDSLFPVSILDEITKGHQSSAWTNEFDGCFSGDASMMPKYHYQFGFGGYDEITRRHAVYNDIVRGNKMAQDFLQYQIDHRGTLMFMMPILYPEHVITDKDFDEAKDFRLSDYCFELGHETEEFSIDAESNIMYRVLP